MKWYAVPNATRPDTNSLSAQDRPAMMVDEYGRFIAEFQRLADAELAAKSHNNPIKREVAA